MDIGVKHLMFNVSDKVWNITAKAPIKVVRIKVLKEDLQDVAVIYVPENASSIDFKLKVTHVLDDTYWKYAGDVVFNSTRDLEDPEYYSRIYNFTGLPTYGWLKISLKDTPHVTYYLRPTKSINEILQSNILYLTENISELRDYYRLDRWWYSYLATTLSYGTNPIDGLYIDLRAWHRNIVGETYYIFIGLPIENLNKLNFYRIVYNEGKMSAKSGYLAFLSLYRFNWSRANGYSVSLVAGPTGLREEWDMAVKRTLAKWSGVVPLHVPARVVGEDNDSVTLEVYLWTEEFSGGKIYVGKVLGVEGYTLLGWVRDRKPKFYAYGYVVSMAVFYPGRVRIQVYASAPVNASFIDASHRVGVTETLELSKLYNASIS